MKHQIAKENSHEKYRERLYWHFYRRGRDRLDEYFKEEVRYKLFSQLYWPLRGQLDEQLSEI